MKNKQRMCSRANFDDIFSMIVALLVVIILLGSLVAILLENEVILYIACGAFLIYLIMAIHTIVTCGFGNSTNFVNAGLLMIVFIVTGFITIFVK